MKELYLQPGIQQDVAVEQEQPSVLLLPALVLVEGEQVSSSGSTTNYNKARLKKITEGSNALLQSGEDIPLFTDHQYSQQTVIGKVVGPFTLAEITEANLPHLGMTDLVGKQGIFTQIQLAGEETISQYRDGRIKKLSVGVDLTNNQIFEISAVPFPAVRGASLYTQGDAMGDRQTHAKKDAPNYMEASDDKNCGNCSYFGEGGMCSEYSFKASATYRCDSQTPKDAMGDDDKPKKQMGRRDRTPGDTKLALTYALTLQEELSDLVQEQQEHQLSMVFWAFMDVLDDIRRADPEELAGRSPDELRRAALEELINQLRGRLNLPAPATVPPTVPLYNQEKPMGTENENKGNDEIQTLDARLQLEKNQEQMSKMQAELAEMKRERELAQNYGRQMRKAELLRASRKLPPAMFKAMFGDGVEDGIAVYSAHAVRDPIDFTLEMIEKYGVVLNGSSQIGGDDIPANPAVQTDEEVEKDAAEIYARLKASNMLF